MRFKKVYIEITNVCNLNCSFCIKNERAQAFMDCEQFAHILKEVQPYTKYLYLHVLGEPLLHPQFAQFLSIAKAMKFKVNITTNATLLEKQVNTLKGNIRQLNLSLHSFPKQEGIHEESYIEHCLRYGDELAKHGTYISYRLWNKKDGCFDEETKKILYQIEHHYGISLTSEAKQKLGERKFLHFEETFDWPSLNSDWVSNTGTCHGMRSMCAILVDGSVVPCCLDSKGECVLGNILKEPMEEILQRSSVKRMMEGFAKRELRESLCKHCGYRTRFDKGEENDDKNR